MRHAASCPTCADALSRLMQMETRLQALAEPTLPVGFEDLIMQRLLACDPARSMQTLPRPVPADEPQTLHAMLLGGALALVTQGVSWLGTPSTGDMFAPLVGFGMEALVRMPDSGGMALGLALGLTLMLVGLAQSLEPHRSGGQSPS
jgi:hypothetical protein